MTFEAPAGHPTSGYPTAPPIAPTQVPPTYTGWPPAPPAGGWPPAPPAGGSGFGGRPPRPPRRSRGTVAALLVALFVVSLLGGALVGGALTRALTGDETAAAGQTPDPATLPTLPDFGSQNPGSQDSGSEDPAGQDATADASTVAERVITGTVDISTVTARGQAAGTGMVISEDGIVLTNHHVVEGAYEIEVTDLDTGDVYGAEVLGTVPSSDVAVIQLVDRDGEDVSGVDAVEIGDSDTLGRGDAVVAIGNSDGQPGNPQVAPGQVVGTGRSITAQDQGGGGSQRLSGLIEVRADIGPGDSGGPVADADGKVVGMTTAASFDQFSGSTTGEGYIVPINTAVRLAERIVSGDDSPEILRGPAGVLGVQVSAANGVAGAAVMGVADGSGAEAAGVSTGSVITAVDGEPVDSPDSLSAALEGRSPGDEVELTWTDPDGSTQQETVTLGEGPVR